ncbi:AbfB domain-containing protein [Streptomyces cyaneofuscatus]|uniref:AbfB domain-containing protein n=1 Tax=Streptomyces cyaneofuscatus TaxID=66883 RepID=UPI0033AF049A
MNTGHRTSARMRTALTRSIVTATALAAVTGALAPATAAAAPSAPSAPDVAARAAGIGTNDTQRVEAAAVVRLDPAPDVLLLSDYDFVHALWQKARDAGEPLEAVRTAAEEAMASALAEDHVAFIVTGVHEAYRLDQQRERDRAEAERAAKLAKSQALLAVGIPSTPELLALSDDNFVRAIARHSASGPEVRAAALTALAGEPGDWREFIVNGAREAHKRDVARELKELEERDRKEAQLKKERAARANAAALFRITPTEAHFALSDDNFIRELLRLAPADLRGSELYASAQRVVGTPYPEVWNSFIHAGADAAFKRDDENRRKKLAEANRKLALQIQSAAANSGVNPNLVAAAKRALAGTDEAVKEFLKEDNLYRARRQSIQPWDPKLAGQYVRHTSADGGKVVNAPLSAASKQADRQDATWVIVPALAGRAGCYSLESVRSPGHYLKADRLNLKVNIALDDRSAAFRETATWCPVKGQAGSGTSFQWGVGSPTRSLRDMGKALYVSQNYGDAKGHREATWKIAPPLES